MLALEKCVYSFMGWVLSKGGETLGSISEFPGTIKILSKSGDPTIIKRIEAWEAERIPGVRCGLDGQDHTELNYRIEETKSIAGRIKHAPLTRFDAEVVFRERLMATIKYCLPIIRFTVGQCHQLSKIVEAVILPKMGFNRYIPKIVLYESSIFGGGAYHECTY